MIVSNVTYHCATIVEVVLVFVSVGTEIHACSNSREWSAILQAQPALCSSGLKLALE